MFLTLVLSSLPLFLSSALYRQNEVSIMTNVFRAIVKISSSLTFLVFGARLSAACNGSLDSSDKISASIALSELVIGVTPLLDEEGDEVANPEGFSRIVGGENTFGFA